MSATETYQSRRAEADELLAQLGRRLEEMDARQAREPRNWGFAGSLGHVVEELRELAGFLGAYDEPPRRPAAAAPREDARVPEVLRRFAAVLSEWGVEDFEQPANECDDNMAMAEAFVRAGVADDVENVDQMDADLWNLAFDRWAAGGWCDHRAAPEA